MEIRDFKLQDASEASYLIQECYQKLDIGGHTPSGIKMQIWSNNSENLVKRAESVKYFVAVDNHKVVGICGYDKEKVHTLFVGIEYQKRGIGKKLLETVLSKAKNEGLKNISTWSTILAEPFYLSVGFNRVKEILLPPGKQEVILIEMIKQLDT